MVQRDRASGAVFFCSFLTSSPTPVQFCLPMQWRRRLPLTPSVAWDLWRVRELSDWMRDDAYSEELVGRVFAIFLPTLKSVSKRT